MINYKNKYLNYKNKYLNLKGGYTIDDNGTRLLNEKLQTLKDTYTFYDVSLLTDYESIINAAKTLLKIEVNNDIIILNDGILDNKFFDVVQGDYVDGNPGMEGRYKANGTNCNDCMLWYPGVFAGTFNLPSIIQTFIIAHETSHLIIINYTKLY